MPRIKRWFPVSHDINRDPEMWDLCTRFGDKALRCWLELLSIADRNEGNIPGEINAISTQVAWAIRSKTTKVQQVINTITTLGWLTNDDGLKVTNYAKYHITREDKKYLLASPPSEPSKPSLPKKNTTASPQPSAVSSNNSEKGNRKRVEKWRIITDRLYRADPTAFKRIMAFVNAATKEGYSENDISGGLAGLEDAINKGLVGGDWWSYARECVKKHSLKSRELERNREWQSRKAEEKNFIANLVGGLSHAKG